MGLLNFKIHFLTNQKPTYTWNIKKTYGIKFKALSQEFDSQNIEIEVNGFTHIMSGGTYPLEEFIKDYCELEFSHFRTKIYYKLKRRIIASVRFRLLPMCDFDY